MCALQDSNLRPLSRQDNALPTELSARLVIVMLPAPTLAKLTGKIYRGWHGIYGLTNSSAFVSKEIPLREAVEVSYTFMPFIRVPS